FRKLRRDSITLSIQLLFFGAVHCGNVLVWPSDASHWFNIQFIIEELMKRGHNVIVLASSAFVFVDSDNKSTINFEVIKVPTEKHQVDSLINDLLQLWMYEKPHLSSWQFYKKLSNVTNTINVMNELLCDTAMKNKDLFQKLQQLNFDVLLADPVTICGDLMALSLGIPFIYTLRFSPGHSIERYCGKIPSPPSYVPAALSELTDKMSFIGRIENLLSYTMQDILFGSIWGQWDSYYSGILGKFFYDLFFKAF
uniref:Uncharacterized protein n=1 Tax=Latimeria chalumnae TaxID=7897 RepID=H3A1M3_LATCH